MRVAWLALCGGCVAPPVPELAVSPAVETVIEARWADGDGQWPEATVCTASCWTVAGELDGSERVAQVLGATQATDVQVSIGAGEAASVRTGSAPAWVPAVLERSGGGLGEGLWATTFNGTSESGPVVLDADGAPVWWSDADGLYVARTRLSPDGQRIYWLAFELLVGNPSPDGAAGLYSASLDGAEVEVTHLGLAHHDFWLHEDGSVAYLAFAPQERGDQTWVGDELIRRWPDGSEEVVFSTWDTLDFEAEKQDVQPYWSLTNHLEYLPGEDAYVVGLRSLDTVVLIDAASGEVLESVGSMQEVDYVPDDPFSQQHGVLRTDDGWVVFDNGHTGGARLLALEATGETAVRTASFSPDPAVTSPVLGDVVLGEGETLVSSWGLGRQLWVVDPDLEPQAHVAYDEAALAVGFLEHWERPPARR